MNRRRFLRGLSLCAAALAADSWQVHPAFSSKGWRPRFSASSILFRDLPLEQACERIAQLGFAAIDLWSPYENCPHLDDAARRLGPDGLKELLARHRLELGSFSTYIGGYPKYAALLGKVGGGLAIQGSSGPCPPSELQARMKKFLESLQPLLDLAERHHSRLAIENHGDNLLDSLDSLQAFVDLNRSSRLGIALAPYHLQAIHASVPRAIQICGNQLFFFYAWQNAPGLQQLPGIGPAECAPWMKALATIGYTGWVNPFLHGEFKSQEVAAPLRQSREYLERLVSP